MFKPTIPTTPLQVLRYKGDPLNSPFKVIHEEVANESEISEIRREELRALAQLIYNAYQEWKQQ